MVRRWGLKESQHQPRAANGKARRNLRSYLVLFQDDDVTRREGALERLPGLGCLLQLGSYHVQCDHHGSGGLMLRCGRCAVSGYQCSQRHIAASQGVESFETLQKPLARANGSEPSCASESIAGGDVTALDGLGGIAATAMQPRSHMTGERDDRGHRFHIRLVMVSNDRLGDLIRACQGLAKKEVAKLFSVLKKCFRSNYHSA